MLKSNDLEQIIAKLGNSVNEALTKLSNSTALNIDNDINILIRELKSKFKNVSVTKGNGVYNIKGKGNLEVQYVTSLNAYLSTLRDVVNYYTDLLMMLEQVHDTLKRLGINSGVSIIIDKGHGIADLLVGYEIPSTYFLMAFPSIIEHEEIPSILNNVKGLSPDEKSKISDLIDQFITNMNKEIIIKETTVNVNDYEYPDKIKKTEEVFQGDLL